MISMSIPVLVAILAVVALIFFVRASRNFFWESYFRGLIHGLLGIIFVLLAVAVTFLGAALATYQRVTDEQHVAQVEIVKKADVYNVMLTYPGAKFQAFELKGDDWQVDARVLKWTGLAFLLGFDTVYRLDRISGRYTNVEDEKTKPRTVYALNPPDRIDVWDLARQAKEKEWLPGVDAIYGSSTFVPMADGANYDIRISPTGLLARPTNNVARKALGSFK